MLASFELSFVQHVNLSRFCRKYFCWLSKLGVLLFVSPKNLAWLTTVPQNFCLMLGKLLLYFVLEI